MNRSVFFDYQKPLFYTLYSSLFIFLIFISIHYIRKKKYIIKNSNRRKGKGCVYEQKIELYEQIIAIKVRGYWGKASADPWSCCVYE